MNSKQKYLLLLMVIILLSASFFYFSTQLIDKKIVKIAKYDRAIKNRQEQLNSAKVFSEKLGEVSKVIHQTMTDNKKYTADEVNSFVKKLGDLANKHEIAIHSNIPKIVSSESRNLIEQEYTLELKCTFVQMGQFLTELEALDRIVKVKTLDVRPLDIETKNVEENLVTSYMVTLEISTFKIRKEA